MLHILLFPFSLLYDAITRLRNYAYDRGWRRSFRFETNVIAVGNLTVGGTGKTPHVEYLIRLLQDQCTLATLSRGYGRSTKGFILADSQSDARQIGDEPMQYFHKFGKRIAVAVGEERAIAIPSILFERPDTQVILMDDAYQHRAVRPSLNILLCDYQRPFYQDYVLPTGRLRESRKGANRADVLIVSKCPDQLSEHKQIEIRNELRPYLSDRVPVFFTTVRYAPPVVVKEGKVPAGRQVILVSGIAQSGPLVEYISSHYELIYHFNFSDHYNYSHKDVKTIGERLEATKDRSPMLLMTEKDATKLCKPEWLNTFGEVTIAYLPIEVEFVKDKEAFDRLIKDSILHYPSPE